jgi:signal transduction histidine kinase
MRLPAFLAQYASLINPSPRAASSASDERAFAAHCTQRMPLHCAFSALLVAGFCLLWWPTDPWLLGRIPGTVPAFSAVRGTAIALTALYFLLLRIEGLRRHQLAIFTSCLGGAFFAASAFMAQLGGPDQPWFYYTYVFPFATAGLPLQLRRRVLLTMFVLLASWAGCFALTPAYLGSPYTPSMLSFNLCMVLVSIGSGHSIFLLVRENFLQSLALERAAAEVRGYSEHLEERVAQKTEELRRVLADLEAAREDERAFISRELHDELGQALTALRYALAFTRERYLAERDRIGGNLAELDELLARTSETVRGIVTELRPRVLDDLGLRAALEWLVRRAADRTGVACTLTVEGDEAALGDAQPIAVFRITQESLTNAARHASAQHIEVTLRIHSDGLELRVRDDGAGFNPDGAPRGRGAGLIGMRERAHELGGALTIASRPSEGTTVQLRLPPPAPRSKEAAS